MDLREVGYDDRDCINVAQDRDRWRAYYPGDVGELMRMRVSRTLPYMDYFCPFRTRVKSFLERPTAVHVSGSGLVRIVLERFFCTPHAYDGYGRFLTVVGTNLMWREKAGSDCVGTLFLYCACSRWFLTVVGTNLMWREKYGVRPLAICGERMSADTVAAEEYKTTFRDLKPSIYYGNMKKISEDGHHSVVAAVANIGTANAGAAVSVLALVLLLLLALVLMVVIVKKIHSAIAHEGPRPTSRLLVSRPHAETEVDYHPTKMAVSCG
ncbi:hypothetical protein ANN_27232 [Periplaneta americana]|uniref:Uncharacterized protein n=1 Tax=Periplaneta americana TaxID=6978 RepID=A0ABQ8RXG3_PERAM|nr:hypothetical protein ANN_27232 [Periplaneta americana]